MTGHFLDILLRRTGGLILAAALGRAFCITLAALVTAGLAAILADALLALPPWGLSAARWAWVALGAAGFGLVVRHVTLNRFDPRRTARRIEARLGLRDSRLINALDLAERPSRSASPVLLKKSIERGETIAVDLSPAAAVDFRPALRAAVALAAAAVATLVLWGLMPRLFAAVLPRYLDPSGDHPPWSLVTFDVAVAPAPVHHGRPATVTAKLGGPETVSRADVVFVERSGRESKPVARLAMLRGVEGEFTLRIDRAERSQEFYIDTPRGRSRRYSLDVLDVPDLESGQVAYRFPKYTGWTEGRHPLDGRGIRGLAGTEVEITVRANLPLGDCRFELFVDGKPQPAAMLLHPLPDDRRTARGAFTLDTSGRYRLTLQGASGAESVERWEGKLEAIPDRPPLVSFSHPEPHLVVVEGYTVPVAIHASDDVGVDRVELNATINGWGPSPVAVETESPGAAATRGFAQFDLPALGARAGDVITYFAIAWDRRPPDGQFAETPLQVIQVISEQEYLELARSQYRMDELLAELDELQQRLDELAKQRQELLEKAGTLEKKLAGDEPLTPDERQELEQLHKRIERFDEALDATADELRRRADQPTLYDVEKPVQEMLRQLAEKLERHRDLAEKAADELQRLMKNPDDAEARQRVQEALDKLEKETGGFDDEAQQEREQLDRELDELSRADELIQQGERMQELIERQRDVADRLGEFRNRDDLSPEEQQRADRLAREQERLQQELREATDALEKAAEQCKGECPNTAGDATKLAEAIRRLGVGQDQSEAAESARKGNGRRAHEAAESAAEKLESLAGDLPDGEAMEGEMSSDPGLRLSRPGRGQSLRQLSQGRKTPGLTGRQPGKPGGRQPGQKGQQPGQMPGQASGRQPGDQPGDKPGEGFRGSAPRMTVMGPHEPMGNRTKPRPGKAGPDGPSSLAANRASDGGRGPESLTPEAGAKQRSAAGNLRGVPATFRDQAEAYFRRLAEEN